MAYLAHKEYTLHKLPLDVSGFEIRDIVEDIVFISSVKSVVEQIIGFDRSLLTSLKKHVNLWLLSLTPLPYMGDVVFELRDIVLSEGLSLSRIVDKLGEKYLETLLTKIYTYRKLYQELPYLSQYLAVALLSMMTNDLTIELLRLFKAMNISIRRTRVTRKILREALRSKRLIEIISIAAILITLLSET